MENFIILFTNCGKTLNIFKGTDPINCEFVLDYKFESSEIASEFAKALVSKNCEKFTTKLG